LGIDAFGEHIEVGGATHGRLAVVITRLLHLFKRSTAVVLIASSAAWRPAMIACMTAMPMPQGMEHAAHHHGAPPHHTLPPSCCRVCPRPCAAAQGLANARPAALPGLTEYAHPAADRVEFIVPAAPHRLPFSIGPPLHLA
jgi:hypothetical protein